jgi:CheY-like chemotaxis protein
MIYSLHHSPGEESLTVSVQVERIEGGAPDAAELHVEVCDPGRRLWTAECDLIFSPSVSSATTLNACGSSSGLGLFVSRRVARAMGGEVQAECVGSCGGSVLHVRLPVRLASGAAGGALEAASPSAASLAAASAAYAGFSPRAAKRPLEASTLAEPAAQQRRVDSEQQQPQQQSAAAPRCLLVDDHELNLKLVRRLLEKHGFEARCCALRSHVLRLSSAAMCLACVCSHHAHCRHQVTTAVNGLDALQQLQASSLGGAPGAPPAPDIALVDLQMPVMGGLEMTRRFRQWYASPACLCEVACCAHTQLALAGSARRSRRGSA